MSGLSAWSPTQKRCSPVSREMMLRMGDDRSCRSRALSAYWHADGVGQWHRDGVCFFSPAFW